MGHRVTGGKTGIIPAVIDDRMLIDLWSCSDVSIMDIAWAVGAFHMEVIQRAKELGLPPRQVDRFAPSSELPTRAVIRERSAKIRRRWTDEEVERRRVRVDDRWSVPIVRDPRIMGGT